MPAKCSTCGKTIRVPKEWSVGAATRKHYWRHHPEVMMAKRLDRIGDAAVQKRK